MVSDGDTIDFAGAVPTKWNEPALTIRIERRIALGRKPSSVLAATIEKERVTASGRKGKPEQLIVLVADDDNPDDVAGLLRHVVQLFAIGRVTVGETYPDTESEAAG